MNDKYEQWITSTDDVQIIIKGNANPWLEHAIKYRYRSHMHKNNTLMNLNY